MHVLEQIADAAPARTAGPGGALAVLKGGNVLERRAWGFADVERRLPFTPRTLVPACSITKQFLCAALLAETGDPETLDLAIPDHLPNFRGVLPTARQLCNNQSGLRDYWAQTVLAGGAPDGEIRPHQVFELIRRMETGHFQAGAGYSYSNANFRILKSILEDVSEADFGTLLRRHVFDGTGMETAGFHPETANHPGGATGYEGSRAGGFIRATNRINWEGDAGVCCSLDDFIAWEKYIHASRDTPDSLYTRLSVPQEFADGSPAYYTFGLLHGRRGEHRFTEHGGGLRGWSLHRMYCPDEALSVVVILNHRTYGARRLALELFDAVTGFSSEESAPQGEEGAAAWTGSYLHEPTGLLLDIGTGDAGGLDARFEGTKELIHLLNAERAAGEYIQLARQEDRLALTIARDNFSGTLSLVRGEARTDIEGKYACAELGAQMTCGFQGGVAFAAFDGILGAGPVHLLTPVGDDVWRMDCSRAMDAAAPGDWTVRFSRNESGQVNGLSIGCWLSRNNRFVAVPAGRATHISIP